jgi:hypothetical protein
MNGFQMIDRATAAMFIDSVEGMIVYDEVSLLFATETALIDFQHDCYRNGIIHFNSVHRDTMQRLDKTGESFDVRFEFFRLPHRPWRIEAMCIISGDAPLHEQALSENGNGAPFHLSYKLPTLETYDAEFRSLRGAHSRGPLAMMAEYQNSYGRMSYWRHDGEHSPYVKPRVNMRDNRP